MPIIPNDPDSLCGTHLLFRGNDILINVHSENSSDGALLTTDSLPKDKVLADCLKSVSISDFYAEPEHHYTAAMFNQEANAPAGYEFIPLREFFWRTKTAEQQEQGLPSALGTLAARAHGFLRLRQIHLYCPTCGAKLEVDKTETAKVCPVCRRLDFPRIEPAVIVLVSKGDQILLVKAKNNIRGFYGCVSGFVEMGETIEQCAVREVKEETNISITNLRYVGSQSWPFPDQLMLAFTADYASGDIRIQEEELLDAGWFTRDKLPEIPKPGSVAYNLIMGHYQA